VIVLANVSKSYGDESTSASDGRQHALWSVDLTVESERCVALIGSSGSGKSTLLRLVLGLIVPDSGSIMIAGEPMQPDTAQKLRLRVGYVIQDGGLFPHLSALENVTLVARLVGWERNDIERRVETLTTLVGLSASLLSRYPVELSGGERQRVGLMRALMLDPPVLLLDEPLGALDPVIRARLQDDLRRIFKDLKKTVLLVTHDLGEAAFLADEIAILNEGILLQKGALKDLIERPKDPFVAEFLQAQRPRWTDAVGAP
jgi:osmoprotectant transport system ATP-binding protein